MSELNIEHIKEILYDESLTNKQKVHTILSACEDHPDTSITPNDNVKYNDIPDSELHPDMKWYRDKILNNDEWTLDQKVRAVIYNDRDLSTTFHIGNDDVCIMLMVFESKRIGCQRQMNTHPKGPNYVRNIAKMWQALIDMLVEYNIEHGPDEILIDA